MIIRFIIHFPHDLSGIGVDGDVGDIVSIVGNVVGVVGNVVSVVQNVSCRRFVVD